MYGSRLWSVECGRVNRADRYGLLVCGRGGVIVIWSDLIITICRQRVTFGRLGNASGSLLPPDRAATSTFPHPFLVLFLLTAHYPPTCRPFPEPFSSSLQSSSPVPRPPLLQNPCLISMYLYILYYLDIRVCMDIYWLYNKLQENEIIFYSKIFIYSVVKCSS